MATCSNCKKSEPVPGRKWCLSCLSYHQEARDRHRRLRPEKPSGTCSRTDCMNPAAAGRKSCDRCRAREEAYELKAKTTIQFNARQVRRKRRMEVFDAYGGAICACCQEDRYEFLTIDHIAGDGASHRKSIGSERGKYGGDIYHWLKKNNFPPGFRVLCMNCNFSLGYHGYCPHHGWIQPTNNGRLGRKAKSEAVA